MRDYWEGWETITTGSTWINKKNGREVVVDNTLTSKFQKVKLHHLHSGRQTMKKAHYFLSEYKRKTDDTSN